MAHTNQTPNYGLSEFVGTDKPAWLVDYNGDMEKIDLGMKAAKDVADAAKDEADQGALDIAAVTITANSADAKASGAISDLADAYDATSTYNVGDFVIYNNILYRCIIAISVPESFDGTHWTRTTVEEIITQINSNLADKQSKFKLYPVLANSSVTITLNQRETALIFNKTNVSNILTFVQTNNSAIFPYDIATTHTNFTFSFSGLNMTITNTSDFNLEIGVFSFGIS